MDKPALIKLLFTTFSVLILLINTNAQSKKKIYPEGEFVIIEAQVEGKVLIGIVNKAYKDYKFKTKYPWFLHIRIAIKDSYDNGLPTNDEATVLNNLEDELHAQFKKVSITHFIGRTSWNYYRDLNFYVEDAEAINEILTKITQGDVVREFEYSIVNDIEWDICKDLLDSQ